MRIRSTLSVRPRIASCQNWDVVCFPYTAFFDFDEAEAAQVDWANCRVFDKLDGSMLMLSVSHPLLFDSLLRADTLIRVNGKLPL